jgi:hypothetical protein
MAKSKKRRRPKRIPTSRSTRLVVEVVPSAVEGVSHAAFNLRGDVSVAVPTLPPVQLLNLPVETLNRIVVCSFRVDFKARFNLLQTSKAMGEIVEAPHLTRSFAVHHWGNCTHAIMRVERRRLKSRDSCDNAFLDSMNDIAAGIDYEDAAELERLKKCPSYLFIETVLAPIRMHLATFAIAVLVLRPEDERMARYHEIRDLVIPFLKQLALWKNDHEHADEYRRSVPKHQGHTQRIIPHAAYRHTTAYLSILSHHRGNEVWFRLALLADTYLLDDPFFTARIAELGDYKHFEQEQAKKMFAETVYRSLDSYMKVRCHGATYLRQHVDTISGKDGGNSRLGATKQHYRANQGNVIFRAALLFSTVIHTTALQELREGQRLQEQRLNTVERNTVWLCSQVDGAGILTSKLTVVDGQENINHGITRIEEVKAAQDERIQSLEEQVTEVKQTAVRTKLCPT